MRMRNTLSRGRHDCLIRPGAPRAGRIRRRAVGTAAILAAATGAMFTSMASAASIDVNQTYDYTTTSLGDTGTAGLNWSELAWDPTPPPGGPSGVGVKVGLQSTTAGRTLTMDQDVTLGQMQFYFSDVITLTGGKITWDTGDPNVQAELGRNRGDPNNFSAGRNFVMDTTFVLNSDLRVTNWVENRVTTFNSTTSGTGLLTLRIVPWGTNNKCTLNIGGTAANTHTGGTTITTTTSAQTGGATITNAIVGKQDAFGPGVLTLDGDGVTNLDLKNYSQTTGGLASSGLGAHTLTNSDTVDPAVTLALNLKDGATTTYGTALLGNINLAVGSASGATGTGVQILSGANSYTGTTNITAGTLLVNGTHSGGAGYTVSGSIAGPATLGGSGGTITLASGNITANGVDASHRGIIAPGASIGTLNVSVGGGSVVFGDNSSLAIETGDDGVSSDLLSITGNLDLSSTLDRLDITSGTPGSFTIASWNGTLSGVFDSVVINGVSEPGTLVGNLFTASSGDLSVLYNPNSIQLNVVNPVPEPASLALLSLGGLGLLARRRRARHGTLQA